MTDKKVSKSKKSNTTTDIVFDGSTVILPKITGDKKHRIPKAKRKKKIDPSKLPDQKTIEEKLITARIGLLIKQPFFGSMATRLKIVRADDMPTAATDGRHFYYNLEFIAGLTPKETEFLFGHEVLHNVFEHHLRKEERNHMLWNIACDYAINDILIESKIGDRIDDTLYDAKYRGMSSEKIYDILYKNADKMDMESLADMVLDQHMDAMEDQGKGLSEEEKKQIKNEIRESLMASAQAAAGKLPVGVDRLVNSLTQPKLSWKEVLRQDIQSSIKFDYTFSKPAKKGMQSGVVLPGMKREDALDICVAIDCSGSISQDDLRAFLSEIQGIMSQYDEYVIRVWSFDTKVYNDETFRSDEGGDLITSYKPKGGGGTLFECNWEHMKENDITPKVFIMFTDMYPCGGWGDESYCENTIFVAYKTKDKVAPFGTTIFMD